MSLKRTCLIAALVFLAAPPAAAEKKWDYTATLYGWLTDLSSTVETPIGEFETEVEFSEILESLDLAAFGAFEARKGRWALIADVAYADLTSDIDVPFDTLFGSGEVETQAVLLGGVATYALIDQSNLRFDVGSGIRYANIDVDTLLVGQEETPNASFSFDGSWADFLIAARVKYFITDNLFTVALADVGGFGIGDSSDLTWQGSIGFGYRFNERWSTRTGYRYLSIKREFGGADITTEISGPLLGVQISF